MKMKFFKAYTVTYLYTTKTIIISSNAVNMIKKEIKEEKMTDIINTDKLVNIAMAHELFHHIEEKEKKIYTKGKNMKYLLLRKIKREACAAAASEIAAVHFSKLVTGISYCPSVFEIILQGIFTNKEKSSL